MAISVEAERVICPKCGKMYGRYKGYFPVSYAIMHKGIGHVPVCKDCIDGLYSTYLSQSNDQKASVRQVCRKIDVFWSESVYEIVEKKTTPRSIMTQYLAKINTSTYVGKSYDDTLLKEGTLWSFGNVQQSAVQDEQYEEKPVEAVRENAPDQMSIDDIDPEVIEFWGVGYTPDMYVQLEQRRNHWMSRLQKDDVDLDIGTEVIIRQLCALELDIIRDRAAGRSIDKNVTALNTLLGSANLKPIQKKQEDVDSGITNTPLGVWLYKYENKRPLPEIEENQNYIKKYIFTWMGHLCKMLGVKNGYTRLYEEEIDRLRVDRPEYEDEDDETLLIDSYSEDDSGGG